MEGNRTNLTRPLLLIAVAAGILAVLPLFAFWQGGTWRGDQLFTAWVHQFTSPTLTVVMKWVSKVAYDNVHYWLIGLMAAYFLIRHGRVAPGLALLAARFGSDQLGNILKEFFARPRPQLAWVAKQSSGYSYPSGSVTVGATLYVMIAYLIAQEIREPRLRWGVQASGWVFAAVIALSRIYLGAHWLTDTLAGLCVALAVTAALSYILSVPVLQVNVFAPLAAAAADMRSHKNSK